MKFINVEQTTDMMISVCQSIIKNKPYLTEVDSKIGDGDHGIGMSKGMENAMNTDNFSLLIPKDTVKFVVSSISDLDKARKICIQYKVAEHCPIFLSPVFGRIEPKEIVEYMIEHHWNEARLQLQMHKFIWPPEQRGV